HDIFFRVDFEDVEDTVEPCRVDSDLCAQKGTILCDKIGRYTLVFDNSYSTFKGKSLKLCVCGGIGTHVYSSLVLGVK
ncbi:unnamed protein product, partial [Allacma fusca]